MNDRDRPLSPDGNVTAERMARKIADNKLLPDCVLCSPARRTRETLAALSPYLSSDCRIEYCDELYEADETDYLTSVSSYAEDCECLLIIGHNPTIHATAVNLIGSADTKPATQIAAKFPTAALAVFSIAADDWPHLRPKRAQLQAFIRPRDLD